MLASATVSPRAASGAQCSTSYGPAVGRYSVRPRHAAAAAAQNCGADTASVAQCKTRQSIRCAASSVPSENSDAANPAVQRRSLMKLLGASALTLSSAEKLILPSPAHSFVIAPPGYRALVDKLDGYSFVYPERWLSVTSSGNDCFLRNPTNIDENLFVGISSPSSSRYASVADLGSPEATGKQLLEQLLNKEFMSTRIGIQRTGELVSATTRQGSDGRLYYDVAVRITSFASRNPYVATQAEVLKDYGVEWDRILLTTLGVANNRLYELRLQTAQDTFQASQPVLTTIAQSFVLKDVEVL